MHQLWSSLLPTVAVGVAVPVVWIEDETSFIITLSQNLIQANEQVIEWISSSHDNDSVMKECFSLQEIDDQIILCNVLEID